MTASGSPSTVVGECRVSWWEDFSGRDRVLVIDRADSWILITDELVAQAQERGWAGEGLVRIEGENGSVTYALRIHNTREEHWLAERITPWPVENEQVQP